VHQIEATDRQIDGLIFELFGSTEEEIVIVEVVARRFRHQQPRQARGRSDPRRSPIGGRHPGVGSIGPGGCGWRWSAPPGLGRDVTGAENFLSEK